MALTPAYHTLPHPSHHGTPHTTISWGPLEPPKTPKPWSLSCLRPAPPLRPSAALCYKEVRSCSHSDCHHSEHALTSVCEVCTSEVKVLCFCLWCEDTPHPMTFSEPRRGSALTLCHPLLLQGPGATFKHHGMGVHSSSPLHRVHTWRSGAQEALSLRCS